MKTLFQAGLGVVALSLVACGGSETSSSQSTSAASTSLGSLSLAWEAPNTTVGHNCTSDIAGYTLYLRTQPGTYTVTQNIPASAITCSASAEANSCGTIQTCRYTATGITGPAGTWYLAISAYDSNGTESGLSSEAIQTFN